MSTSRFMITMVAVLVVGIVVGVLAVMLMQGFHPLPVPTAKPSMHW